jgi:hypothetical protein
MRLWSLELCSPKLYILKKVFKFTIATNKEDVKNILAMGNFVWQMKAREKNISRKVENKLTKTFCMRIESIGEYGSDRRTDEARTR